MNARPLPPGRVASPQPGKRDERECTGHYDCRAKGAHWGACPWATPGLTPTAAAAADQPGVCKFTDGGKPCTCGGKWPPHKRPEPAPLAGQDTERLRDEAGRTHAPESWNATVERMARAIHQEQNWGAQWRLAHEHIRDEYRRLAAAALRVVTEPADGGAK